MYVYVCMHHDQILNSKWAQSILAISADFTPMQTTVLSSSDSVTPRFHLIYNLSKTNMPITKIMYRSSCHFVSHTMEGELLYMQVVLASTVLAQITGATYLQRHNINLKMQKKGITLSIKLFADPGKNKQILRYNNSPPCVTANILIQDNFPKHNPHLPQKKQPLFF